MRHDEIDPALCETFEGRQILMEQLRQDIADTERDMAERRAHRLLRGDPPQWRVPEPEPPKSRGPSEVELHAMAIRSDVDKRIANARDETMRLLHGLADAMGEVTGKTQADERRARIAETQKLHVEIMELRATVAELRADLAQIRASMPTAKLAVVGGADHAAGAG